jgi:hypothetical protein
MGSSPSSGNENKCAVKFEANVAKGVEDFKNDSILKEIAVNTDKEPLALKPSQSVNLEKVKN